MTESRAAGACDGNGAEKVAAAFFSASRWLGLAAAPAFAAMGLATSLAGEGAPMICAAAHDGPPGGMAAMYGLMAVFHLPPWLRLVAGAKRGARAETRRDRRGPRRLAGRLRALDGSS